MLVVLGLMDLGRGIWTYTTVTQASREASPYIMVHGSANRTTAADIENVVARHAIGLDASKLQVSTSYDDEDSKRGDTVDVSVRYDFQLLTAPLVLQSGTITLAANSRTVLTN
jgi:Flp pilus assembly protein TadG